MDSPQLFLAFGAAMLVIALIGVAIDWLGKPLRHRRFVPKIYRYPDERQPRHSNVRSTEWSDASFVLPVVEPEALPELIRYPDPRDVAPAFETFTELELSRDLGPPTAQVPVIAPDLDSIDDGLAGIVTLEETDPTSAELAGTELDQPAQGDPGAGSRDDRSTGWSPGGYVFNFTSDGNEPSASTVRTRYWKNVAATSGASVFGADNVERMASGRAPQRRNHRTGRTESMQLPSVTFADTDGATPVPSWPDREVDPFE